jgi:SAM-dependent methyltransferase
MSTTTEQTGSAAQWGPLWGARAEDWARNEEQQLPTYEAALRRLGIGRSKPRLLDIGCGTGVFLRAAAERGAEVHGIDASRELIDVARRRLPEADLRVGEMESLPYGDETFDVVTGFNSFFFAADMVAALREAGRVTKEGAPVSIQVWGNPECCDIEAMKAIARRYMPAPPSDRPARTELWEPGVLEGLAAEAGLRPETTFDVSWAYEFADESELGTAMMSAGGLSKLVAPEREPEVRAEIVDALASTRTDEGGYRLENKFHFLICRA